MSFRRSFLYGMGAGVIYSAVTNPLGCVLALLILALVLLVIFIAFWKVLVVGAFLVVLVAVVTSAIRASRRGSPPRA